MYVHDDDNEAVNHSIAMYLGMYICTHKTLNAIHTGGIRTDVPEVDAMPLSHTAKAG
jgi:hypothetical protein